jgi:hypothetical protein
MRDTSQSGLARSGGLQIDRRGFLAFLDESMEQDHVGSHDREQNSEVVKISSAVARPSPGVRGKARYVKSRGV